MQVDPGQRVAIEVDGPSHFLTGGSSGGDRDGDGDDCGGWVPLGATRLKRRQLRALGWRVLPIPVNEWPRGSRARQAYVAGQLARVCLERVQEARASDEDNR